MKLTKNQKGFSLIELLIAIVIITAGLVALSGALVYSVTLPQRSKQKEIATQLANSIMESIVAVKQVGPVGFASLDDFSCTTNPTTPGRFDCATPRAMLTAGPDGVYGTCDDGQAAGPFAPCGAPGANLLSISLDPGSDGIYATGGNTTSTYLGFTRVITITDLSVPPVLTKRITVQVFYNTPTGRESIPLSVQLSSFQTL